MDVTAWHSSLGNVHHTHPDCKEGQRALLGVWYGTGDKPLCPECAKLTAESKQPKPKRN